MAQLLLQAREGDKIARDALIAQFTPFVLRAASRVAGRFLRQGQDDEISIALLAFNEAIDAYQPDKGGHFLSFANTVIRRRLIDHFRHERLHRELPMSAFEVEDDEGSVQNPIETEQAIAHWSETEEQDEKRREIAGYAQLLTQYGLSFSELVRCSPKHEDARRSAQEVARMVIDDPELAAFLEEEHKLPMRALAERSHLSRKTLERQRKYILAVALVHLSGCAHLKAYLS